jgi:lipopolysaccharide export system permease protein
MKKLDRYIAWNFLVGYAIAFCVLIGLRIIIDLFVNLDEFTEQRTNIGIFAVLWNVLIYYGLNSTLYFRDFAGMITVVAAAFSFGKMVRNNELVAVMASGVSLKRTIGPIVVLALLLTGMLVIDQELLIPSLADKLVRSKDYNPSQESYKVTFISDSSGSLIFSENFEVQTATLHKPTILLRRPARPGVWEVTGRLDADRAVYNSKTNYWDLYSTDPRTGIEVHYGLLNEKNPEKGPRTVESFPSDITAKDVTIRQKAEYKTLLPLRQLLTLAGQRAKITDLAQLYSQIHFRITDPIINLVMLMISLPILVCRDPKSMKTAVLLSFTVTSACFVLTFFCKMFATEVVFFDRVMPELWAWLPVFIFLPLAFIELDSMKT